MTTTKTINFHGEEAKVIADALARKDVEIESLRQQLASRDAEVAGLRKDAERYRWLCEQNEKGYGYFHIGIGARSLSDWRNKRELDELIDETIATK